MQSINVQSIDDEELLKNTRARESAREQESDNMLIKHDNT